MGISESVIEQVRDQVRIEDVVGRVVSLQPGGRAGDLKGLCPFHNEDTPSFHVDMTRNVFYCFGCQEGGDVFNFVQKTRGIGFIQAVRELADELGVVVTQSSERSKRQYQKKQSLYDVCQLACDFFHKQLMVAPQGQEARDYLTSRGLDSEARIDFSLGYAPASSEIFLTAMHASNVKLEALVEAGLARYRNVDRPSEGVYAMFRNRLIIPIRNAQGRVVAFGGRRMPSDNSSPAKYVNSPETPIYKKSQTLFGLSFARGTIQRKGRMIIVEGYFDVIALHRQGFKETIATCGTALTTEHVQVLRPLARRAIALFDTDEAGVRAAEKSLPLFWEGQIEPLRLALGDAKDPDEFFMEESNTAETFERLISKAEPLFDTKVHSLIDHLGMTPGAVEQIIDQVIPIVQKMPTLARQASIQSLSRKLGVSAMSIQARMQRAKGEDMQVGEGYVSPYPRTFTDLFWLTIHFPEETLSAFDDIEDPNALHVIHFGVPVAVLSTNFEEISMFGRLLQGESLQEVLQDIAQESFRKMLLKQSLTSELFAEENAGAAAKNLRDRLEMSACWAKIKIVTADLKKISPSDQTKWLEQLTLLQNLRSTYEDLSRKANTPNRSAS